MLKFSSQLLITILICNTIVNVSITIVAVYITMDIVSSTYANQALSIFIEIVIVTILILTLGEIFPKVLAKKNSVLFSRYASLPILILFIIIYPVSKLFERMNLYLKNIFKVRLKQDFTILPNFNQILDLIDQQVDYSVTTKNFLKRINELMILSAKDVLVPRIKLCAVELNTNMDALLKMFEKKKQIYIPVYEKNMDNIIGVVPVKKILEIKNNFKDLNEVKITDLIEKPIYIPETKNLRDLLLELKNSDVPVAITIDEHGGVSGMITEDDILRIFFPVLNFGDSYYNKDLTIFLNKKSFRSNN